LCGFKIVEHKAGVKVKATKKPMLCHIPEK
jgi:hypothetical protein